MTVMQEEIFGPLLPIKTYDNIEEAVTYVRNHPSPLALYYFGNDLAEERLVLDGTISGGVTINDCLAHASVKSLPFGGIGPSGMGAYHGKTAFLLFLTLAPSTGRADRRKPSTLCGLLLDRKPVHFYWRRSRWSDAANAETSMRKHLYDKLPPPAVITGSDIFGAGALQAIPDPGLPVSDDVSVAVSDKSISTLVNTPLTTVASSWDNDDGN